MRHVLTIVILVAICKVAYPSNANLLDSNNRRLVSIDESKIWTMENQIVNLSESLEDTKNLLNIILGFLAVFLAFSSGVSFFGFYKAEKRESQLHNYTVDAILSSRAGADEANRRENVIFTESQRTLSLVNDTLTLATDASRRASKSLELRLIKTLNDLERSSKSIVEKSLAFDDDKNLTIDKDVCSEIHRIGRKIEGLENNLIILEDSHIELMPYCNFIRGADSYLSEQYDQAIDYWDNVVYSSNSDPKLKSLSYFWIGYIHNNLGDFTAALNNFKKAQELAVDSRKYELIRIQLETRFFNGESPEIVIHEFNNLLTYIDNDNSQESNLTLHGRKKKIQTTLGNIYYQYGNEISKNEYYQKSKDIFGTLLGLDENGDTLKQLDKIDNNKKDRDKWIIFGYAESLFKLGEKKHLAKDIFKRIVFHLAENEFLNREEKRTKVLAKTTQLICVLRSGEDDVVIRNTKSQVDSALSGVDKRLTIYSQFQRRNVRRDVFREDLNKLLS